MILKSFIIIALFISAYAGCRKQERNACESICTKDSEGKLMCELRGAIILPNSPKIEASLPRVR